MRFRHVAHLVAGAVVASALALLLVAIAATLHFGLQPGPHTAVEITIVGGLEVTIAVGTALLFAIILAVGGSQAALRRAALAVMLLLVGGLAAIEIFGQALPGSTDFTKLDTLADDLPLLLLIGLAGLLSVTIEWRLVRRSLSGLSQRGWQ